MSLFNKALASIGIGSAKVDTKLENATVAVGEELRGVVNIQGGNTEQKIDEIFLSLHTTYLKEVNDRKQNIPVVIDRFRITESFTIGQGETKKIPFSFILPLDVPISIGRTKVWVTTSLDIKNAVDPKDKDYLKIIPNRMIGEVLNVIENLGFRLREADCEQASYRLRKRMPFIQEFEYVPVNGPFRGRLDELELVFFQVSQDTLEIFMQVDRKARGLGGFLAEALERDESNLRLIVTENDLPILTQKLHSTIERYS
ncbi:sporulation protein [Mesobacillus maritimus]|uniref:sporulation protein n=1 Tax=Mesobacillus maritimus TaxID=1643336 RepID=UPI0020402D56|nr:sporulation protein [Mesobacillus maritimus]MCM3588028.1 sporulation protein [Mesobacillus maritimus]MCM3668358.1 sporulation protein [Mesobacillus maritimus]